jgi:hypothetical protein
MQDNDNIAVHPSNMKKCKRKMVDDHHCSGMQDNRSVAAHP